MKIATAGDPQTLDPRHARELFSVHHVHLLYQGLFRKSVSGETLPALCESYSMDGSTYFFTLRNCFWSNGDPITAQDFVRSWNSVIGSSAPFAYQFQGIAAISAESDKVLKVELKRADSNFLEILCTNSFFPVHIQPNVYSGPFILKEWIPHEHLILKKNRLYWDEKNIEIEEVQFDKLHDMVALRLFEQGKLDWIGSPLATIPLDALKSMREAPICTEAMATRFVRVNVTKVPKEMRQTLMCQLDREQLVKAVSKANEKPAYSLLPPPFSLLEKHEQRFPKIAVERLTLIYIPTEINHFLAQLLEQQWNVELRACSSKIYYDCLEKKEYELALGAWYAGTWDPLNFLEMLKCPNETGWQSENYQALLDQASIAQEPEVRTKLINEAQYLLNEEVPLIPLYHPVFLHKASNSCKHFQINPLARIDFHKNF